MYRPTERRERVVALYYDKENDESYHTRGRWTGETGEYGEHFQLKLLTKDGDWVEQRVHKEDIYDSTEETLKKVPREILLQD